MPINLSFVRKFDWVLFGAALLLVAFGLAAIYSTSLPTGDGTAGDFSNFWKQLGYVGIGVAFAFFVAAFNYRHLAGYARIFYILSIVLLVAVLMFGKTIRGTRGWFGFGGLGIQPVEFVKFLLIVYLAKFFSDYSRDPGGLKQIIGSGVAVLGVVALVFLQPDFGSAFLILATWGSLLVVSGIKRRHLAVMAILLAAVALVSWFVILKPYQRDRVAVFLNPEKDPFGKGYNVTQSIIAIGSGGVVGKGLGFGSQSQLRFLPERQTDFIFAVVAEELGYLGVAFVAGLFAVFFYRGYRIAARSQDDFTMFLTLGIMASIAIETFVNVGGNLRLLPVTGVTLPFLSYGGSSMLAKFLMVGVLESAAVRQKT